MSREAPRGDRLEHVVLQHEIMRIGPVVRDVRAGVVAHHVRRAAAVAARRVERLRAAGHASLLLADEPVHAAAVDVGRRSGRGMGAAEAAVFAIVEGADAPAAAPDPGRTGPSRIPRQPRNPVGAGVGAEVRIERAVLLHDDHDVADLVDPDALGTWRHGRRGRRPVRDRRRRRGVAPGMARAAAAAGGEQRSHQPPPEQPAPASAGQDEGLMPSLEHRSDNRRRCYAANGRRASRARETPVSLIA